MVMDQILDVDKILSNSLDKYLNIKDLDVNIRKFINVFIQNKLSIKYYIQIKLNHGLQIINGDIYIIDAITKKILYVLQLDNNIFNLYNYMDYISSINPRKIIRTLDIDEIVEYLK